MNNDPSWDDYIIDEMLGEGAYGKIFKVKEKNDLKRVLAIKTIDTTKLRESYKALSEIDVMQ